MHMCTRTQNIMEHFHACSAVSHQTDTRTFYFNASLCGLFDSAQDLPRQMVELLLNNESEGRWKRLRRNLKRCTGIWCAVPEFDALYQNLVHFLGIWYTVPRFDASSRSVMHYQEMLCTIFEFDTLYRNFVHYPTIWSNIQQSDAIYWNLINYTGICL